MFNVILLVLPFSLLLTAVAGGPAAAKDIPPEDGRLACSALPPPFIEYAAKYVCGPLPNDDFDTGDVVAGTYRTSINIHNPQQHNQSFCKKIVVARREGACPPTGTLPKCTAPIIMEDTLGPDLAELVDCFLIKGLLRKNGNLEGDHVEGFVVIEVPGSIELQPVLDVVGKYTARPGTGSPALPTEFVSTLDIVDYQGKRILKGQ